MCLHNVLFHVIIIRNYYSLADLVHSIITCYTDCVDDDDAVDSILSGETCESAAEILASMGMDCFSDLEALGAPGVVGADVCPVTCGVCDDSEPEPEGLSAIYQLFSWILLWVCLSCDMLHVSVFRS